MSRLLEQLRQEMTVVWVQGGDMGAGTAQMRMPGIVGGGKRMQENVRYW